ncbi:HNH endonuclease [Paenibacillus alkaliterrae]|uniref:HNH endonuclease n=1 Tax=Paenibacillus alkaliterrae TaxID=320909 RepID=UPI001F2516AE|nr:HNH endonuclease [Paenibacillus alkaliterrae]MCF2938914.1 HNH endonuclease [Paenibacillus alkaliterrae]
MKNEYEVRGDVVAIIINSPKYGRQETLISVDKLERVKEFPYTWRVALAKNKKSFYVHGNLPSSMKPRVGDIVCLHRWITNAPKGMVVDHINHITLDNTDGNLRVVTQAENQQNIKGAKSNSRTGIRGVSWHKKKRKWHVRFTFNKSLKHVGYFDSIEEAEREAIAYRSRYLPNLRGDTL